MSGEKNLVTLHLQSTAEGSELMHAGAQLSFLHSETVLDLQCREWCRPQGAGLPTNETNSPQMHPRPNLISNPLILDCVK